MSPFWTLFELRKMEVQTEPVSLMTRKSRLRWFGHVDEKMTMTGSNLYNVGS